MKEKRRLHNLKCWPGPFLDMWEFNKDHEIRKADRDFQVGDTVAIREFVPEENRYTGRVMEKRISYISRPGTWGLPSDICVMSFFIGTCWENFDFDSFMDEKYESVGPKQ